MRTLLCVRGVVIYPAGGDRLAVEVDYHPHVARRLAAIPGVELWQDGDREKTFVFPVELFDVVAAVVQPRKRRRPTNLTPEQRQAGYRNSPLNRASLDDAGQGERPQGGPEAS
jgi:hypothetical protein